MTSSLGAVSSRMFISRWLFEVTRDCNVIGAAGQPHDRLFATGPLTRGAFWEMLAVPELRRQAPEVARQMLGALHADTNAGSLVLQRSR